MKQMRKLLIALSVLLFLFNFIRYNINEDIRKGDITEIYDPSLIRLNSLSTLIDYVDSIAQAKKIPIGSLEYAIEANDIVSRRFYHQYSTKDINENWVAAVSQKITGYYLSSNITAGDILKKPYGYCGQQSAVLMELLQSKGLKCRALYLPHHFVMQCHIDGRWCFFDPNAEPVVAPAQRYSQKWLSSPDSLAVAYNKDISWIKGVFGSPVTIKYGEVNEIQGPNAQIFQAITKVLSKIAFLFPLLWFVYLKRKNTTKFATNNKQQAARHWHYDLHNHERAGRREQSYKSWPGIPRFSNE